MSDGTITHGRSGRWVARHRRQASAPRQTRAIPPKNVGKGDLMRGCLDEKNGCEFSARRRRLQSRGAPVHYRLLDVSQRCLMQAFSGVRLRTHRDHGNVAATLLRGSTFMEATPIRNSADAELTTERVPTERPAKQRSRRTNNPNHGGVSKNTAAGRRAADLLRAFLRAMGAPDDVVLQANALRAARADDSRRGRTRQIAIGHRRRRSGREAGEHGRACRQGARYCPQESGGPDIGRIPGNVAG